MLRYLAFGGALVKQLVVAATFLLRRLDGLTGASEGVDSPDVPDCALELALVGNETFLHKLGGVAGEFDLRPRL